MILIQNVIFQEKRNYTSHAKEKTKRMKTLHEYMFKKNKKRSQMRCLSNALNRL